MRVIFMLRNEGKLACSKELGGKENMKLSPMQRKWRPMCAPEGGGGDGGTGGDPPKKATFEELLNDSDYKAEYERRMNEAVQSERGRMQTLADERVSEAEKLSKMTDLEKQEYQQRKKDAEIAEREKNITRRELSAEAKNTLSDKGLPTSLAAILDYTDAESCKNSLKVVEEAFNKAVEAGVEEKLKGGKPPKVAPATGEETLEEEILKYMMG